jgi:RNA polymerase sigma factor (sigma-70 family)
MTTIDIVAIKDKRVEYSTDNKDFLTLDDYILQTKKLVKRYAGSLSGLIIQSEDAISNIATDIMMADWRWENGRKGEGDIVCTRESYRVQCAKYAILDYTKRLSKKKRFVSLDSAISDEGNSSNPNEIHSKEINPALEIEEKEETSNLKKKINTLLSSGLLTEIEELSVRMYYYENKTYQQIGDFVGLTRERIRQIINSSLDKLRKEL